MTMSDPLGDMLARISNGQRAKKETIQSPASKARANVLEVLQREGYIRGFSRLEVRPGVAELSIELKYVDGEPVIREITRVSKPGRRIYSRISELPRIYNPPSGVIATANSRITPDGYKYSISTGWEAPWRTDRIYRVLESGRKFSAADMIGLQTDIYSDLDHFVAERLAQATSHSSKASPHAKEAAEHV